MAPLMVRVPSGPPSSKFWTRKECVTESMAAWITGLVKGLLPLMFRFAQATQFPPETFVHLTGCTNTTPSAGIGTVPVPHRLLLVKGLVTVIVPVALRMILVGPVYRQPLDPRGGAFVSALID